MTPVHFFPELRSALEQRLDGESRDLLESYRKICTQAEEVLIAVYLVELGIFEDTSWYTQSEYTNFVKFINHHIRYLRSRYKQKEIDNLVKMWEFALHKVSQVN